MKKQLPRSDFLHDSAYRPPRFQYEHYNIFLLYKKRALLDHNEAALSSLYIDIVKHIFIFNFIFIGNFDHLVHI